jgi:large subunit ribosomal protein L22
VARWVRMSPRKARLVAEHIRGRSVPEARTVLAFTPRAAARELEKVLRSAVANAEANHNLAGDDLVVSAAFVDEGPVMKRWRARARGRAVRIQKPTCHITVLLAEREGLMASEARKPAESRETKAPDEASKGPQGDESTGASESTRTTRPRAKRAAGKKEA